MCCIWQICSSDKKFKTGIFNPNMRSFRQIVSQKFYSAFQMRQHLVNLFCYPEDTCNLFCVCIESLLYHNVYQKTIIKKIVRSCYYIKQEWVISTRPKQQYLRPPIRIKTFHLNLRFSDNHIIVIQFIYVSLFQM